MKSSTKVSASILFSVVAFAFGCGGEGASAGPSGDNSVYTSDPGKTVVVGGNGVAAGTAQTGTGCVTLPSGQCVEAKSCAEGERRDVVVDSAFKVVAVVCYPADATPTVVDAQGNVDLDKNDNGGVVALDDKADGVDIAGNVTAAGNNVTGTGRVPRSR